MVSLRGDRGGVWQTAEKLWLDFRYLSLEFFRKIKENSESPPAGFFDTKFELGVRN